jgi:hypothetical protein
MGIGEEKKALRGDFSVKQKDSSNGETVKPAKVASAPKLEVITPSKSAKVDDDDNATTSTAATGISAATSNGGPEKGSYIPPHLRKKMLESQQSK